MPGRLGWPHAVYPHTVGNTYAHQGKESPSSVYPRTAGNTSGMFRVAMGVSGLPPHGEEHYIKSSLNFIATGLPPHGGEHI